MQTLRAAILAVVVVAANLLAGPITFIQTGTGSGTIGGTPFSNAAFTITSVADTADRTSFSSGSSGYAIDAISASIAIAGVGDYTFTTGTRMFVNNTSPMVGFSRASGGADLFDGPSNPVWGTWDMLSAIGPVSGSGDLMQWSLAPVNTSGGVLVFEDGSSQATFQAILGSSVPEPGSLALMLAGIAAVGLVGLRRRV